MTVGDTFHAVQEAVPRGEGAIVEGVLGSTLRLALKAKAFKILEQGCCVRQHDEHGKVSTHTLTGNGRGAPVMPRTSDSSHQILNILFCEVRARTQ